MRFSTYISEGCGVVVKYFLVWLKCGCMETCSPDVFVFRSVICGY